MARPRLPIVAHLTHDEITARHRACRDGLEKTHWQVVWLLSRPDDPPTPAEISTQVGLTPSWVRTVLKRWNEHGPEGLIDRRRVSNGGKSKLTDARRAELFQDLQSPPEDGGLWTGPKVAARVERKWGVVVCKQTGWEWLVGLGFTLQVPRPVNPGAADEPERRRWKKRPGRPRGRAAPNQSGEDGRGLGRG